MAACARGRFCEVRDAFPGLAHNFDMSGVMPRPASGASPSACARAVARVAATRWAKRSSCFFPAKRSAAVVPSRRVIT